MGCETEDSEFRVLQAPFSGEKREMEVHEVAKWQIVVPTEQPAWSLVVLENERPLVSYSGGSIPFVFVHGGYNPTDPAVHILDTDNDGGYDKVELWYKGESPTLHTIERRRTEPDRT